MLQKLFVIIPARALAGIFFLFIICSAQKKHSSHEDFYQMWQELQNFKYQLINQASDIKTLQEKYATQEEIQESLRSEQLELQDLNKELFQEKFSNFEDKVYSLEADLKSLSNEIRTLKDALKEVSPVLTQYKQKIHELEKESQQYSQYAKQLEKSFRQLVQTLNGNESSEVDSQKSFSKNYKVQAGDTLEKIANRHHTTVKELKELNQISKDRIFAGQMLQLPE